LRVGIGYDVHAFDPSRPLVLGGVTIEDAPGLAGWSDADVVTHAVTDAVLGAAGLGDLGTHFSAEQVAEGVSSLELLAGTRKLLADAGFQLMNVDAVVAIQEVRMAPYRDAMAARLADALGVDAALISIKATTTDRLGFVGKGEGVSCVAVALIEKSESWVSTS